MPIFPILSFFMVLGISYVIIRMGGTALYLTGMARDVATFQAISAFTGVGFTTVESEVVSEHPLRRRIVMGLMLSGNIGIVTVISTLILSGMELSRSQAQWQHFVIFLAGVLLFILAAANRKVDDAVSFILAAILKRWTTITRSNYLNLLRLEHDYLVTEVGVEPDSWLRDHTLAELQLGDEGVIILGIYRDDGSYLGAPRGNSVVKPGDTLVLYGKMDASRELSSRKVGSEGDEAHQRAVQAAGTVEEGLPPEAD